MSLAEAEREVNSLNSIALLFCHSTYYVGLLRLVLERNALALKDGHCSILLSISRQ